MLKDLGIGVLAGLVAALLFGMLLQASPLAILLHLVAPLPLLIVGLGWSHRASLVAVAAGAAALALGAAPFLGIMFALYIGLPAWWLGYLALLGRPAAEAGGAGEGGGGNGGGVLEWYPLGRLLAWIAGSTAVAFVTVAVIAAPDHQTFRTKLAAMAGQVVDTQMRGRLPSAGRPAAPPRDGSATPAGDPPPATDAAPDLRGEVVEALAALAPAFATQGFTLLLVLYLWAAARIVQISGRLIRPWPDIPATAMPRAVLAVLAGAVVLALAPGYPGVLGVALLGAFAAAFALQGLAAFHDRSRGRPARGALLVGLYVVLFLTQGVALLALTLFGIADTALNRRAPGPQVPGRPS